MNFNILATVTSLLTAVLLFASACPESASAVDSFDVISGVIESPRFKGKTPLEKLTLAADLFAAKKLKQSDLSFLLLDWADQYLRAPKKPIERLKRWSDLTNEEKLRQIRIPRDFLNRMLLAEYLVSTKTYLNASPYDKLKLLAKLESDNLVEWSVSLAYSRIYAGGIVTGAKKYDTKPPLQALAELKALADAGLVGWHYRVPTEAILIAEALAMDKSYQQGPPLRKLEKLRDLESGNLISPLTRKELEKLPAWRFLVNDNAFLKAGPKAKRERILQLKAEKLVSPSTAQDLVTIFRLAPLDSSVERAPVVAPGAMPPPVR